MPSAHLLHVRKKGKRGPDEFAEEGRGAPSHFAHEGRMPAILHAGKKKIELIIDYSPTGNVGRKSSHV